MSDSENNQIAILPSYETVEIQVNSLFTPTVLTGGKIKFNCQYPLKIDEYEFNIDGSAEAMLGSIFIEGYQSQITGWKPIRNFSTSIGTNILEFGSVEMRLNKDMALLDLTAVPSPFLIGSFQGIYSEKKFSGLLSLNARQQISNITARFSMNKLEKPTFEQATALFGSNKLAFGFRFQFDDERKKNYQMLIRYMLNKKTTLLTDLTFNDIRKQFLFSSSIVKQTVKGLKFGAQFRTSKDLKCEVNFGWDLKLGKNKVKSLITTNGIVSTYFSRKIMKDVVYEISGTLDYNSHDSSLGIGLIFDS